MLSHLSARISRDRPHFRIPSPVSRSSTAGPHVPRARTARASAATIQSKNSCVGVCSVTEQELRAFLENQDRDLKQLAARPNAELAARLLTVEQMLASRPAGGSRMSGGYGEDVGN